MLVLGGTYLIAKRPREETHEDRVLLRVLEAEGTDGLHHHRLKLIADLVHEGGDLFHEPVDAGLVANLDNPQKLGAAPAREARLPERERARARPS